MKDTSRSDLQTEFGEYNNNISQKRLRLEEMFDSDSADLNHLTVFPANVFARICHPGKNNHSNTKWINTGVICLVSTAIKRQRWFSSTAPDSSPPTEAE